MSRQSELAELSRVYDSSALSNRNFIINGAAVLDQRNGGSSVTASTGTYTLDRWRAYDNTDGVFTVQQVSDSPDDFSYSIKVTATTADSSLAAAQQAKLQQRIEGYNVASLALGSSGAKSLTLSFYVKSSVTGTYGVGFINSANDRSFVTSYTINSANTWEYKTITLAGDTTGTWLTTNGIGLNVQWSLGMGSNFEGTSGSWQAGEKSDASGFTKLIGTLNATWQITGVQLEVGDSATPFEHRSYGDELARCQRYLTDLTPASAPYIPATGAVPHNNTAVAVSHVALPVTMRAAPSVTVAAASDYSIYDGSTFTCNSVAVNGLSANGGGVNFGVASGLTARSAVGIYTNGDKRTFLVAEL